MIRAYANVRGVAREISAAADGALGAYRAGRVEEEPQITDRIIGAIEDRIGRKRAGDDGPYSVRGRINWTARSLRTGAGIAAEEKRHGADLMGVLDIDIPDYQVIKGFLSQAKRAEPGSRLRNQDWDRLRSQCEKMLLRTPASFVWVYSKSAGIRIFSANAVLALKSRDIFELYSQSVSRFFESHIECFIGDGRLNSTDIETLDALAELPVKRVLELSAR